MQKRPVFASLLMIVCNYSEHQSGSKKSESLLMLTEPDIEPKRLQNINIPVLITVGENDLILPEETKRIVDNLKDVKLVVLDGEDHGS